MDYGFSKAEIMAVYMDCAKKIAEIKMTNKSGKVKIVSKDIQLYSSIAGKILSKHPELGALPL